jgi:hypothetical protein
VAIDSKTRSVAFTYGSKDETALPLSVEDFEKLKSESDPLKSLILNSWISAADGSGLWGVLSSEKWVEINITPGREPLMELQRSPIAIYDLNPATGKSKRIAEIKADPAWRYFRLLSVDYDEKVIWVEVEQLKEHKRSTFIGKLSLENGVVTPVWNEDEIKKIGVVPEEPTETTEPVEIQSKQTQ